MGLDTKALDERKYILWEDYFSHYTKVDRLQGISSSCTIKVIRKHFITIWHSRRNCEWWGGPGVDNQTMRELTHKYGFKWNPSSPEMPKSNRMAESAVKQIKYIIRKCNNENGDPCLTILDFTNTPSKSSGISPAQRVFRRQFSSVLPTVKKFLSPFNAEETKTKIRKAKQRQKKHPWPKRI